MRQVIALAALVVALSTSSAFADAGEVLSPPLRIIELVQIVDGDTFDARVTVVNPLSGEPSTSVVVYRVRLVPADTAETKKPRCPTELAIGRQGTDFTRAFLLPSKSLTLRCLLDAEGLCERDSFGRVLARTYADGVDLGEALIAAGLAIHWPGHDPWCD